MLSVLSVPSVVPKPPHGSESRRAWRSVAWVVGTGITEPLKWDEGTDSVLSERFSVFSALSGPEIPVTTVTVHVLHAQSLGWWKSASLKH